MLTSKNYWANADKKSPETTAMAGKLLSDTTSFSHNTA
jgi:hypothetical protein